MSGSKSLVVALALLGCGRRDFNTVDAATDAPPGDATTAVTDAATDAPTCPASYTLNPTTGIYYSPEDGTRLVTWVAAKTACLQEGQQLAWPRTTLEALTLAEQAGGADVWVDISQVSTPGVWSDRDGEPVTFLPWALSWPTGSGDCVHMGFDGEMRDATCVAGYAYVCECRLP